MNTFQRYLTDEEEKLLADEILATSSTSYCLGYKQIIQRATDIVKAKHGSLKGESNFLSYHWLRKFLDKFPELRKTKSQILQARRARCLNADTIRDYYAFLKGLMYRGKKGEQFYRSIWSADESGFSQRELDSVKVDVVGGGGANGNVLMPEWNGHTTVLAAISHTGDVMPPMWITEGEQGVETAAETLVMENMGRLNNLGIPNAVYAKSGKNDKGKLLKGTMTKELWRKYFTEIFLPGLSQNQKPALLIIDGHESHFDMEFFLTCKAQGVDVVQEPANCSSVLQALDQTCFQVLKRKWRETMMAYVLH